MTDTGFWFIIGVLVGWFASLFVDKNFQRGERVGIWLLVYLMFIRVVVYLSTFRLERIDIYGRASSEMCKTYFQK